ncbi:MAG: right-handed parallel beta-helix repeat-containing protein [Lentisphaerae bacterium]|nr:right-handed parallel beta-helix repeat-containing protein [Lentisphaerota bacterium]
MRQSSIVSRMRGAFVSARSVSIIVACVALGLAPVAARAGITYVSLTGTHQTPFDTPARAATNIMDAVAVAADGATADNPGVCHIEPGTYTAANAFDATKTHLIILDVPVRLVGNGASPDAVVIDGLQQRRLVSVTHGGATVENLTLHRAGGLSGSGTLGFGVHLTAGMVTNCVVSSGRMSQTGTAEPYVYVRGSGKVFDTTIRGLTDTSGTWSSSSAACQVDGSGAMIGCVITNNTCGGAGAVYATGASALVEDCLIASNPHRFRYSTRFTAGLHLSSGAVARRSVIRGNSAPNGGTSHLGDRITGGAIIDGGLAESCIIEDNYGGNCATTAGVCLRNNGWLINSLVRGNRVANGTTLSLAGGVLIESGGQMLNCTVTGNECTFPTSPNGVRLASGTITNCIVTANTEEPGKDFLCTASVTNVGYSCFPVAVPGAGNLAGDPLFADADGRLRLASPCRDTGITIEDLAADIEGTARPFGSDFDIGCYEYSTSIPACDINVESARTSALPYTLMASAVVSSENPIQSYAWTLDDGVAQITTNTTGSLLEMPLERIGDWTITLTVTFSDNSTATIELPDAVRTLPHIVHVSLTGNHIAPFDTPDKAATNIMDAVRCVAGTPGDPGICHVAPGVYTVANADAPPCSHLVVLNAPVRLVGGGSDPSETVIDGEHKYRIIRLLADTASVENITFHRGVNLKGDAMRGYGLQVDAGTVSNCVVSTGLMGTSGTSEHFVLQMGGLVVDTVIHGNVDQGPNGWTGTGCACYLRDGAVMSRCTISNNTAGASGVVYLTGGTTLLENSRIIGNAHRYRESGWTSAGVYLDGGARLRDCEVALNHHASGTQHSKVHVGGVYAANGTVENCVITNNTAGYACCVAGVYLVGSSTLANSLIVGNRISSTASQTNAGGVFLNSASCQMINCTVVGNESTHLQTPDGVYFTAGTVVNSIITANGEGFADDFAASVPEPNVTYSCFAGVINGEGNIAADPQFADAANRDYTLSRASPARDAGTAVALADDLVGTPRPQGAGYDMGCYERPVSDVPECDFRIDSEAVGLPPLELQTTAITSWSAAATSYVWTVSSAGGATIVATTTQPVLSQTITETGVWTVSLQVLFADGASASASYEQAIRTLPHEVYVSLDGAHIEPYDAPARAATNIMDAVRCVTGTSEDPGICHVAPGVYTVANADAPPSSHLVILNTPVRLVGEGNDPSATVIDGEHQYRIIRLAADGASVENITLHRGANLKGDVTRGYGLQVDTGSASNCVVSAGLMGTSGTSEHFVLQMGGLIVDTLIHGNVDQGPNGWTGTGCACNLRDGAVMSRCTISNNTAGASGVVYLTGGTTLLDNSRIIGNAHRYRESGWTSAGVYLDGGARLRDSEVALNRHSAGCEHTRVHVGGVYAANGTVENCVITNNTGGNACCVGGVYLAGTSRLINSLVAGNSIPYDSYSKCLAGGVAMVSDSAHLVNCTVADNFTGRAGYPHGLYQSGGLVTNAIVAFNGEDPARQIGGSVQNYATSCIFADTPTPGTGNICADPKFRNRLESDYRLKSGSPCRRAGTRVPAITTTLDGLDRNPNLAYDLGCYAAPKTGLIITLR